MLVQPEKPITLPAITEPQPTLPRLRWVWVVSWLVAVLALASLFLIRYDDHAELQFGPDALSGSVINGPDTTGFYKPETDAGKNQYVWMSPQAVLTLHFTSKDPVKLTFDLRSAAVAGGPADPVNLLINGRPVQTLQPDPHNPNFQSFAVVFAPGDYSSGTQKIELQSTAYKPPSDARTLGTMLKAIRIESDVWPGIENRLQKLGLALVALLVLSIGLGWLARTSRLSWAGILGWLVGLGGVGVTLFTTLSLAPLRLWLLDPNPYTVQSVAILYLGLFFCIWTLTTPVSAPPGWTGYRWAYHQLQKPVEVELKSRLQPLDSLTGLRMVAAVMVFLFHVNSFAPMPQWLASFTHSGNIGVVLFFTLSGFVICYNYYDGMAQEPLRRAWKFGVARFARIYPMYFFVLIFSIAAVGITTDPTRSDLFTFLQYLFVTQAWNPDRHLLDVYVYNGQVWTLTVEFFLYFCFPLVAWLLLRHCQRIWQLFGLAAVAYLLALIVPTLFVVTNNLGDNNGIPYWLNHAPPLHLADFILGCVAARLYMKWVTRPVSRKEQTWGQVVLWVSVAAIVFLMIFDGQPWLEPYRYDLAYLPFFTSVIFCVARYRTAASRFLATRPLVRLGEASYSFYLLHQYFLITRIVNTNDITIYLYIPMMFLICCLISLAAYQYIETPARRFLHKILL